MQRNSMVCVLFFTGVCAPALATIKDDNQLLEYIERGVLDAHFFQTHDVLLDQMVQDGPHAGQTPLVAAILHNHPCSVRTLLEAGASPNATTLRGELPLEIAVTRAPLEITKLLLDYHARITPYVCRLSGLRPEFFHLVVNVATTRSLPQRVQLLNDMIIGARSYHQLNILLKQGAHAEYVAPDGLTAIDAVTDLCNPSMLAHLLAVVDGAPSEAAVQRLKQRCGACLYHACDCCLTKSVLERGACRALAGGYRELAHHIVHFGLTKSFLHKYFTGSPRLNINRTLELGSDVTALKLAVTHDNRQALILLFKYGARMTDAVMRYALERSPRATLKILVHHGARFYRINDWPELVIGTNPHAVAIVRWMAPCASCQQRNRALALTLKHGLFASAQFLIDLGAFVS